MNDLIMDNVNFDFSEGNIDGFFVVHTNYADYYGTNLFVMHGQLRVYTYLVRPSKGKSFDMMGEKRIPLEEVQDITIKSNKY